MTTNTVYCGSSLEVLRGLPSCSVNMCVTSPPYYGLRDYGIDGQIGVEATPEEYVARLTEIFHEVKRVLKDDGTLWLNIADSYAGSGKGPMSLAVSGGKNSKLYNKDSRIYKVPKTWDKIKPKDMIGIPWMLAFALRNDGWYLRSDIIWHKTNCLPESVKDRPVKSYEHIFLLSKSRTYYFDYEAIQEPIKRVSKESNREIRYCKGNDRRGILNNNDVLSDYPQKLKRKRDVWEVNTNTHKLDKHFAMYPEKLIEPCILAGSAENAIVLDPFFGSGTTGAVAVKHGRQYIGIDLNPEYCEAARKRISEVCA